MKGQVAIYVVGVIFIFAIMALIWSVTKKINYNFSYKTQVEQTVRDLVKPEALK